ncbi:MAG: S9 family peptidase [Deltaproteobacteria bacterium]|nr:S9 family peptidase [Deltaproteobacteria bacterium]
MKPKSLAILFVSVASSCADPAARAPVAAPSAPPVRAPAAEESRPRAHVPRSGFPVAAKKPAVHELFGTRVSDDYEWLEDAKSPETVAFVDAENAHAKTYFDALADRPKIRARVEKLATASSADYLKVVPSLSSVFVLVMQPPKQQAVLVMRSDTADPASEKVILDPNVLDPSGKTTIDLFVPSPDKKTIAVSLSKNGSESGDLHLFDVATGTERKEKGEPLVIKRVYGGTAGGSIAWNGDGSGFYYTRYPRQGEKPEADLDFFQQVWFHRLGTPEAKDELSLGKDLPRIAEVELERSDDGRFVLARVANGDGGEFEHHALRPGASSWTRLTTFADKVIHTTFAPDGKVYGISRKDAPRGKVLAWSAPFDKGSPSFGEVVLEEGEGVIEDIVVTKSALYTIELAGGPSKMRRIPIGVKPEPLAVSAPGKAAPAKGAPAKKPATPSAPTTVPLGARGIPAAELPVPPVSSVTSTVRIGEDLLVRMESYVEPPAWYRYKASEHRFVKTSMAKAPPADMSDVEVARETCVSKDGTKVPISILSRKGTPRDGKNPTLLTGYGGFGYPRKPRLRPWYRAWIEQGGVFVEANLRGGSEMGAAWHEAGRLTKKQNVFDDFAACAKTLIDRGVTKPERLAIWGRSNGGLLMGASLVQHPELFRAVVSGVGIYDVLRYELSPNGAFNIPEYGTVKNEEQFRAMLAYSPLHNVKDGTAYPAILMTTGANDPRVDPYHSRKMVARLQAATSSEHPILLQQRSDTGHGMGTPLAAEIDETADMLVFLFHELGVTYALTRP